MEHNADPLALVPGSFTVNESSHEIILPTRMLVTVNTTLLNKTAQGGCLSNPCHHGGTCVSSSHGTGHSVCHCTSNWEGLTCLQDVNECLQPDISCPLFSSCQNRFGSFTCRCPLGFNSAGREGCTPGKTFLGDIMMTVQYLKEMDDTSSKEFAETEKQILALLNESLSSFAFGYKESVVVKLQQVKATEHKNLLPGSLVALVINSFKIDANVTERTVATAADRFIHNCDIRYSSECHFAQTHNLLYAQRDICELNVCDVQSSTCVNNEGIISCTCLPGFFKHHSLDRACRACENGFILQNGECIQCSFGFSGHGCREPYLLSSVLLAASAGLLLLIFTVALGVICKRKRRVDLRCSHFNHEAFQLSPYSELPDIPRNSWLREENEIHDNSSTHSLLRTEESYISPAYRSSLKTLEGEESYAILPGVQCDIFGGRQNLSYTYDENRRSDYF
uniref:protein HEG-like isoform X1 n=1 Tax=Myxine glutinosa TaxID=7769 RepID=UPI00358F9967